jgi:hypothetical protein
MDITVNVENIDLGDYIGAHIDDDGDRSPAGTLGDVIARQLVERFARQDTYRGLVERVQKIRDEEIRAQLAPQITEALEAPIRRTNSYGEITGRDTTTLREVIVDEARKWLNSKKDDGYGRTSNATNLQAMIRKAVEDSFQAEIADAVKAAREAVVTQLGSDVGEQISAVVRHALAKR